MVALLVSLGGSLAVLVLMALLYGIYRVRKVSVYSQWMLIKTEFFRLLKDSNI